MEIGIEMFVTILLVAVFGLTGLLHVISLINARLQNKAELQRKVVCRICGTPFLSEYESVMTTCPSWERLNCFVRNGRLG